MKHIMIDIETMGTNVKAPVLSIGACAFSEEGGILNEFHYGLDLGEQIQAGREVEGSTIYWWLSQSKEAQNQLLNIERGAVGDAYSAFLQWLDSQGGYDTVWAKPPSFDLVILKSLFGREPWDYWKTRDLRTLLHITDSPKLEFKGTSHNALDDAKHQALQVIQCLKTLKGN